MIAAQNLPAWRMGHVLFTKGTDLDDPQEVVRTLAWAPCGYGLLDILDHWDAAVEHARELRRLAIDVQSAPAGEREPAT